MQIILLVLFSSFLAVAAQARPLALAPELLRDWADFFVSALPNDRPDELNDPALFPATREFGPTLIPLSSLPIESPLAKAEAQPWSSWWFPRIDRDLFDDGLGTSPLEKYDLVREAQLGRASSAAKIEAERFNPSGPRWEGLCDAWAIASLLFPEPKVSRSLQIKGNTRVAFSVGDQKALLLKTLEAVPPEALQLYGQRFTGDSDGWIYPDLFPQELHRFVEVQLFERQQAFIMDHDAGVEVWSEPVYKANYRIQAVPGKNNAVFVKLWLYSATPFQNKSEMNRVGIRELVREYDYFLYGEPDGKGNLVVSSGVWAKGDLVDSRRDHPDFVFTIANPEAAKRSSRNPEIDPAIVDQIVGR